MTWTYYNCKVREKIVQLRPTVLLPLATRRSFFEAYYEQPTSCGLWVPGNTQRAVGAEVDIEVAFAEDQMVFHSRGIVRAKRLAHRKDLPAGIGIEFLSSELRTRDVIVAFARGQASRLVRRKSRRFPVVLQVEYNGASGAVSEVTEDFSRDGAFIRTAWPREVGAIFNISVVPPNAPAISVRAEVMWQRHVGRSGMGVRFVFDDIKTQQRISEFIDQMKGELAV